jgi:Fe2+ transport system protein B
MSTAASVLLMGHPNVGKSALFNRLAGANISESNYPGTTVEYTESHLASDEMVPIIDVPGTFSLEPKIGPNQSPSTFWHRRPIRTSSVCLMRPGSNAD